MSNQITSANADREFQAQVEQSAKLIYARMPYPDSGRKPEWIEGEHSMMQDLARDYARAVLEGAMTVNRDQEHANRIADLRSKVQAEIAIGRDPFAVNFVYRDAAILLSALDRVRDERNDIAKFADGLWNLLIQLNPHNLPGSVDSMWTSQMTHPRQVTLAQFAKEWAASVRTEAEVECAARRAP